MIAYKDWKTKEEIVEAFCKSEKSSEKLFTNDIKEGDFIQQVNGWLGEIIDNKKGNTRMANVHGLCTEAGSIYAWDILGVCKNGVTYGIQLTPKQEKDKKMVSAMGF